MYSDNNRLTLELDKHRRDINRDIMNPQFNELSMDDFSPILSMVAHARANYLKALFDLTGDDGEVPDSEKIVELRQYRETFDELVAAVNALETAMQRGYLDVKPKTM